MVQKSDDHITSDANLRGEQMWFYFPLSYNIALSLENAKGIFIA